MKYHVKPVVPSSSNKRSGYLPPSLIQPLKIVGISVLFGFAVLVSIAAIGYLTSLSLTQSKPQIDETAIIPTLGARKVAAGDAGLEPYCAEGWYRIPGEKQCSRAPKCGEPPYNSYAWVAQNVPMANYNDCLDEDKGMLLGDPPESSAFYGYVPLCCYEMARLQDPEMCIGNWERLWCHPQQCAQINNDTGCDGGPCLCGNALRTWCNESSCNLLSPVPLSTRLNLVADLPTNTPNPNTPTHTLTPSLSQTPTVTVPLSVTPTVTPSLTPSLTTSPRPSLTPTPPPAQTVTATFTPSPSSPTIAPRCDQSCGTCGWRDGSNVCHTSGTMGNTNQSCCYYACVNQSCISINGYGVDTCTSDTTCKTVSAPSLTTSVTRITPTPPVSGDNRWALILLIPIALIMGAIIM